jgi:MFS family permease
MNTNPPVAQKAHVSYPRARERHIYFGWWVVLASVLGLMVGDGTVIVFSFGVFLNPIASDFGWSRAEVALALTLHIVCLAVSTPFVGWLIDRKGSRRVLLAGIILFSAGVSSLSLLGPSRIIMYGAFALLGCFAAIVTPVPYARVLCSWFDRRRGLALGISLAGVGLGTAILPQIAQILVASGGWRRGYAGLGLVTLLISLPIVYALFREPRSAERNDPRERRDQQPTQTAQGATGYLLEDAIRRPEFWILFFVFALTATAVTGAAVHLVPLLTDAGLTSQRAAHIAGALGLALICGRVLSGLLLDKFFAPYVTVAFFMLAACGLIVLAGHVTTLASVFGTALVGLGIGAELDVLSYLTSRYFGLRSFAQISATIFLGYVVGTSVGPSIMAFTFDRVGTYRPTLFVFAGLMVMSSILLCRLGPYPRLEQTSSRRSVP